MLRILPYTDFSGVFQATNLKFYLVSGGIVDEEPGAMKIVQTYVVDAVWSTSIKGSSTNLYLADTYNTQTGAVSGPSDVWPYTAAIEAHCAILEALNAVKDIDPDFYAANFDK